MLLIPCPYCGDRGEDEFHCAGESHVARPPLTASDREWSDYLYCTRNPHGVHFERWLHRYGCRRWFNVARDTRTHEIRASYRMTDAPPLLEP